MAVFKTESLMKTIVPINYDCFIESDLYPKKGENKEVLKNEDGLYIHSESVGKVYFYFPIYDSNTGYLSGKASTSLFVIFGSLRLLAAKFFQSSTLWFRKVRRKYESIFSLG